MAGIFAGLKMERAIWQENSNLFYNFKELNSANNLNDLEANSSPETPGKHPAVLTPTLQPCKLQAENPAELTGNSELQNCEK